MVGRLDRVHQSLELVDQRRSDYPGQHQANPAPAMKRGPPSLGSRQPLQVSRLLTFLDNALDFRFQHGIERVFLPLPQRFQIFLGTLLSPNRKPFETIGAGGREIPRPVT